MADVLVGQVGHPHDGALLDGPGHLLVLAYLHLSHLVALLLVFLLHQLRVAGNLLDHEGRADDVDVVTQVFFHLGIFVCTLTETEDVVLLYIPNAALSERF